MNRDVILKPGKEKAIINRHQWIFSGAVHQLPEFENGELLSVKSSSGQFLGIAYFNRHSSIIGRMVSFDAVQPLQALHESIKKAVSFRQKWFDGSTTAYRLINGEGDCLPGLTIDRYGDVLVMQVSTLGMEKLKGWLIETLVKELSPCCIYEKSTTPSRKDEGLAPNEEIIYGVLPDTIEVLEKNLRFIVHPIDGQKTGFFLDQREMRHLVRQHAANKHVLNCFAYTGGFSVAALAGGCHRVDTVEISADALNLSKQNVALNQFSVSDHGFYQSDVFEFLRTDWKADFVILDPPAFAKKKNDVIAACRGYKEINRLALQKMPTGSLLLSSSCSYFVDEELFQKVLFQAAQEANRRVKIIGRHLLAPDHPVNIFHPEGNYLKSFFLYVE